MYLTTGLRIISWEQETIITRRNYDPWENLQRCALKFLQKIIKKKEIDRADHLDRSENKVSRIRKRGHRNSFWKTRERNGGKILPTVFHHAEIVISIYRQRRALVVSISISHGHATTVRADFNRDRKINPGNERAREQWRSRIERRDRDKLGGGGGGSLLAVPVLSIYLRVGPVALHQQRRGSNLSSVVPPPSIPRTIDQPREVWRINSRGWNLRVRKWTGVATRPDSQPPLFSPFTLYDWRRRFVSFRCRFCLASRETIYRVSTLRRHFAVIKLLLVELSVIFIFTREMVSLDL